MTVNFSAGVPRGDPGEVPAVGVHLLVDLYGAQHLDNMAAVDEALRHAASSCGATLLDVRLHSFGEGSGITGVALLAESHISIHTWPEVAFAAIDVFMCGRLNPRLALPALRAAFGAKSERVQEFSRGSEQLISMTNAMVAASR